MGETLKFDYYYGTEAEQFSFYRVPRLLIKDKRFSGLSSDAKLLYGLMLDRMALSIRKGWIDDLDRAYIIYTLENVTEDLCCGKNKAVKIMAELDSTQGIGLIEKVRRGLGKPDIIYVKNFVIKDDGEEKGAGNTDNCTEVYKSNFKSPENQTSGSLKDKPLEVYKSNFRKSENQTSGGLKTKLPEFPKSNPNYTENNYTERNQTNLILSGGDVENSDGRGAADKIRLGDEEKYLIYESIIKENIEYDLLCERNPYDVDRIREMVRIMADIASVERGTVRINKTDYPYNVVKGVFLKLGAHHIEYVLRCIKDNRSDIGNIRNYMLTMLYNSYNTYHNESAAYVSSRMYENGDKY